MPRITYQVTFLRSSRMLLRTNSKKPRSLPLKWKKTQKIIDTGTALFQTSDRYLLYYNIFCTTDF